MRLITGALSAVANTCLCFGNAAGPARIRTQRTFHAPIRSSPRAATAQLLDTGHLRRHDPHHWHWRPAKLRHLPETDRGRPQGWARVVVVRQCAGDAADGSL